jgi:hypothetical protein
MKWELYEVWQEDEQGHEELIDTTKSYKEAVILAKKTIEENPGIVRVYRETDVSDFEEVEVFERG